MRGYIKLYRQITDNEFYFAERFSKIMCWIDLLLLATHSDNNANIRDNIRNIVIKLNPGELCYSKKELSKRWKMNERTVSKILKMFQDREMITYKTYKIKGANITTLTKILKWDEFQNQNIQQTLKGFKNRKSTVLKNSISTSDLTDFEDNNTLQSTAQNTAQSTYNQECKRMLKNVYNLKNKKDLTEQEVIKQGETDITKAYIEQTALTISGYRNETEPGKQIYTFINRILNTYADKTIKRYRIAFMLLVYVLRYEDKFNGELPFAYFNSFFPMLYYSNFRRQLFDVTRINNNEMEVLN